MDKEIDTSVVCSKAYKVCSLGSPVKELGGRSSSLLSLRSLWGGEEEEECTHPLVGEGVREET